MRGAVLIVDDMHNSIIPGLQRLGFEPHYRPDITRNEILDIIHAYTGILIRSKTEVNKDLIDKGIKLKFVGRAGAGTDMIDVEYCHKKDVLVINSPEGNKDTLAEHALGILLALLNKIHIADPQVRGYKWERESNRGSELFGKTVGIIGYGNMGGAFARRLSGFSCQVLAYDKYKTAYEDIYARESNLNDIFSQSDIVSFHVPLTQETSRYYNRDFFSNFHKDIYVVNTARGGILPLKDLLILLKAGKIKGAALDVLENEKIDHLNESEKNIFSELIAMNNVIFTPHIGGWSYESYVKINDVLLEKIGRMNLI